MQIDRNMSKERAPLCDIRGSELWQIEQVRKEPNGTRFALSSKRQNMVEARNILDQLTAEKSGSERHAFAETNGQAFKAIEPNLRRLRILLAVARCGSVNRAAEKLHLTQSSLTRAIRELAREIDRPIFERTARGMVATAAGSIVISRVERALHHIQRAESEIVASQEAAASQFRARSLAQRVTHRHLHALAAIADYHTEAGAARHLSLSQPAVNLALRDLEVLTGDALFSRTPRGMIPTPYGEILIQYSKLAFAEIASAADDVAAQEGTVTGRVVIGSLPLSGAFLIPRAVHLLLKVHPLLQVEVVDGTYRSMMQGLRNGEIDVVVGGLSKGVPENDVIHEPLFEDEFVVVARRGHPLATAKKLTVDDVSHAEWVLPRKVTPGRARLDDIMREANLRLGRTAIETNSLPVIRGVLANSDRLSIVSHHQLYFENTSDTLVALPITLNTAPVSVGLRTLMNSSPRASVRALLKQLREVGRQLTRPRMFVDELSI
jgi:LysR family transcriptional regulator of gallate degradation